MTRYERGFFRKCAERGFDGRRLMKSAKENFVDTYAGRTSVSAGAGALLGLLYEAAKKKEQKKYWARSLLNGALGGAIAGAGTLAFRRNVLEPIFADAESLPDGHVSERTKNMVDRIVAEERGKARMQALEEWKKFRSGARSGSGHPRTNGEVAADLFAAVKGYTPPTKTLTPAQRREVQTTARALVSAISDAK